MKFIVDAQLPRSLSELLKEQGHDSIHTLDLPSANATPDSEIRDMTIKEERVVISKDNDFLQSYLIKGIPEKLILVRTGNIHNRVLLEIFRSNISRIVGLMEKRTLIEITATEIITHY